VTLDPKLTGKYPLIPFRFRRHVTRVDRAVVGRYAQYAVCDISDWVGRLYTMTDEIRPLYAGAPRVLGSAVTVKAPRGDNAAVKAAAEFVTPGDVLVIDAQGFTGWCAGGFGMLISAIEDRGLGGVIVNGAYRDVVEFRHARVGLYGVALSPATGPKLGPGEINVPVACGGVVVHPGDLVVADEDGVVVVPSEFAGQVADHIDAIHDRKASQGRGNDRVQDLEQRRNEVVARLFEQMGGNWLDETASEPRTSA
jgi:4-hydroxy-4-methyl-2-oxoglutarate aldolase